MNLTEIQTEISLDFDSSPTPLSESDTEYSRRTKLVNRFERQWATRKFYGWASLFNNTTLTTTAEVATVTLPSGFSTGNLLLSKDNRLKIGENWYEYVNPDDVYSYSSGARIVYITGNDPSGYTLHISPTPTEELGIDLNFYTKDLATDSAGTTDKSVLTSSTDVTKCPNPYYLIYSVLSILYKTDDEGNKGIDYERLAEDTFQDMVALENKQNFNQDNYIDSVHNLSGYPALGE